MKDSDSMPPLTGVDSAKRTGLGRWSAGKGAAEAWRFAAAPLPVPVFFPIHSNAKQSREETLPLADNVQLDLSL